MPCARRRLVMPIRRSYTSTISIRASSTTTMTVPADGIKVQAAVARAPNQPFTFDELTLRPPKDDEILVKITATGNRPTLVAIYSRIV
jgi:hypothetical protein